MSVATFSSPSNSTSEPDADCPLCPRLAAFRQANRAQEPDWHNAPVASFGDPQPRLLIVGLAPGLKGANRTGRPFTGDFAGDLLYATLLKYGFARGTYRADPNDGLKLVDCMISNSVRCVPPQNKPTPAEIATCRPFLAATMAKLSSVQVMLALGRIAHDSAVIALGLKLRDARFGHGAIHHIKPGLKLYDSFHCSRYNTNTGRLTVDMFESVVRAIRRDLDANGIKKV